MLADEPMEFSDSTEYELDPQEYGDEQIIAQLTKYSEAGRAYSDQVLDCRVFSSYQKCSKLFLSKNRNSFFSLPPEADLTLAAISL
mgnify:CR=1 FL=1